MVFGKKFSGFIAWWLWRTVYLMKLPRLSKKLRVMIAWTLDVFFGRDIEQTITVRDVEALSDMLARIRSRAKQGLPVTATATSNSSSESAVTKL
jgi:hypothetical protein